MNRTEACLKDLGEGELWFFDSDPEKPAIGRGTFLFEQRMKTYRNKSESGSDFAEFDQQLVIIPTYIDPALQGVTMKWNVASSCSSCDVAPIQWTDDGANPTVGALDVRPDQRLLRPVGHRRDPVDRHREGADRPGLVYHRQRRRQQLR